MWYVCHLRLARSRKIKKYHILWSRLNFFPSMPSYECDVLNLRPQQNDQHLADDILKLIFLNKRDCIIIKFLYMFIPWGLIDWKVNIHLGNGLVPNRWQAMTCNDIDQATWCHMASINHDKPLRPGTWFNIKMSSYQCRKSHYLHNGISYTCKMLSLYWIRAQMLPICISDLTVKWFF